MNNIAWLLVLTLAFDALGANPISPNSFVDAQAGNSPSRTIVSPYAVASRGPHHSIWQQIVKITNESGKIIYQTNSYAELATGLNHWDGEKWVNSSDQIQITSSGASASNTHHQVSFAANINGAGSIDLTLPDGRHLRSHVVGLAYCDEASGKSVMFAETKDSIGQLLQSSNQVVYTNAFTDFQADVRYTHTKGKFEQDVIFRSQPPSPAQYGLNPQSTLIEIWTEFLNPPEPVVTEKEVTVLGQGIHQKRYDQKLDFGTMQVGRGKAFGSDNEIDRLAAVAVVKKWVHIQGRTFLVEQIPLATVTEEIQKLPPTPSSSPNDSSGGGSSGASLHIKLPVPKLQAKVNRPLLLAKGQDSKFRPGFVMDYDITVSTLTGFTFQSDTTYFISDVLDLYGTNVIEGGTVIKMGTFYGGNTFHDTFVSLTAPYSPAIFTVADDDTVGTSLTNGTTPSFSVTTYLSIPDGGSVTNMRFSYAWNALAGDAADMEVSDCQFIDCNHPITMNADTTTLGLHNLLITMDDSINTSDNFCSCQPGAITIYSDTINIYGENVTANLQSQYLMMYFMYLSDPSHTTVNFTNSILITPSLTAHYWGGGTFAVTANTNATFYASSLPGGLFQTVGTASYYLADGSPYRDYGNTNVTAGLLADLKQKTTYPPVVFAQALYSYPLTLFPQAQRDKKGNPDLGYHYDPIDYAFGGIVFTNAALTVTPGTVIAGFGTNGYQYGFSVGAGSQLSCTGAPTNLCRVVSYNTVQEQSNTNWLAPAYALIYSEMYGNSPSSAVYCRFTDFSVMAQDALHFNGHFGGNTITPCFQDCQFHGGSLITDIPVNLTNCLLERVSFQFSGIGCNLRNCLFWRGSIDLIPFGGTATVQDNLFDQSQITDIGGYTYGYNGFYYTNASVNILTLTNSSDVFATNNFSYQTSWLGRYYQTNSSPFINKGNTTANNVGLYQYTTQASQTKEGTSTVDIGFHYVAVDGSGNPDDYDSDGIPDYLEDANGNGVVDSGETDWQDANDLGLTVIITRPADNSVLP